MKKFSIEIKWGIIAIIIFLAWMTLEKELGFHDEKIKWQPLFNLLYIFPTFLVYYLALREKKIKYYQQTMNWKQGLISAIIISFIVVLFSPITQFITHEFISPDFLDNTINYTVSRKKLTLSAAKEYTTLTSSIWKNISDGLSFGLVIGAIVAYLLKTKTTTTSKNKKMKYLALFGTTLLFTSCVSTKSTIRNIDNSAIRPSYANEMYLITEYAEDSNYGFDADYPINIGFIHDKQEEINVYYFFNGLEGPNGEKINFKKIDTCCPFPTKNTTMGAGTLSIYEVSLEGTTKKFTIYINTFEKGKLLCPKGLKIKKKSTIE